MDFWDFGYVVVEVVFLGIYLVKIGMVYRLLRLERKFGSEFGWFW